MPLFRHSALVIDQETPIGTPLNGRVWRIRPAEGDAVTDPIQDWRCQILIDREGAGGVQVQLQTSYDREIWVDVATAESGEDPDVAIIPAVEVLAPYVRGRTQVTAAPEGATPPTYRLRLRLVSNGPFKLEPV